MNSKASDAPNASELTRVILRQSRECAELKERFFAENAERISACAHGMARSFAEGGRLFTMGNGGSLCDALHVAVEFMHPIIQKRPALPAIALATDASILTAIGNDQDFAMVFAQQLRTVGRRGDMALAISTSGKSANLIRGLKAAKEMSMLCIGFVGRDGGKMPELCDHCFVVPSFSLPRIQEVHGTLLHLLWDLVHLIRGEEDVL
ncbi:MAG TPA: SIS domain-containing protein [Candidatus Synoicihabitans sp.]|nr:SIS domain-containing protein [Candidatus Synoicihabitans sp.]